MSATKVLMPDSRLPFGVNGNEESNAGLSKLAIATAEAELYETPALKEQALAVMRNWVKTHPELIDVRIDDNFLLRFLRVRKYNIPMAQHNLVKYLNFRQSMSHLCFNLDYTQSKVAELIDSGYIFASPFRDSHGRRVVIALSDKLDATKYTKIEMAKAHAITYETLMEDEENQVMGLTHFGDIKALSLSHVFMWTPLEMATCLKVGEQAIPLRHKSIHIINYSASFKFLVDFVFSRVSQKIKSRVAMHPSIKELHENLDKRCLPKEYGGDMPLADMIDLWKKELSASRSRLLLLDRMKSLVPIKRSSDSEQPTERYRKLEVD